MRTRAPRRRLWVGLTVGGLAIAGAVGSAPRSDAASAMPEKEYVAVFERGTDQPFAVLAKPKGVPIGPGTNVQIQAFGLRIAPVDGSQLTALLHRLPELDRGERQQLPPGFQVYADRRYVAPAYAGASHKYTITFTDPADAVGLGGGHGSGSGGAGDGGGGM